MSIICFKEKDGTVNVHASGYVTKDPKCFEKVVLFSVCYGRQKYLDCKAWAKDVPGKIAACLERHDQVTVDGIMDTYTDREDNERSELVVDGITPLVVPAAQNAAYADAAAAALKGNTANQMTPTETRFEEIDDGSEDELPF